MRGLLERHGVAIEERQAGRQRRFQVDLAEVDKLIARLRADPDKCPCGCGRTVELGREWYSTACAARHARAHEQFRPLGGEAKKHGLSWQATWGLCSRHDIPRRQRQGGRWETLWDVDRVKLDELVERLRAEPSRCGCGCGLPVELGHAWINGHQTGARMRALDPEQRGAIAAIGRAHIEAGVAHARAAGARTAGETAGDLGVRYETVLKRARTLGLGMRSGRQLLLMPRERQILARSLKKHPRGGTGASLDGLRLRLAAEHRVLATDVAKRVGRAPSKVHRWAALHGLGRLEDGPGSGIRSLTQDEAAEVEWHVSDNQLAPYYNDPDYHAWHSERRHKHQNMWAREASRIARKRRGRGSGPRAKLDDEPQVLEDMRRLLAKGTSKQRTADILSARYDVKVTRKMVRTAASRHKMT